GPGICAGTIGLSASDPAKHHRKHKITVASGRYSVASGRHVTVRLTLSHKGQAMLTQHYTLASTVSLRGTTRISRKVTFRYPVIKSPIGYTATFGGASTAFSELTVSKVPRGGKVTIICHGGGCPFPERTFKARHGKVILAPEFEHSPLHVGAHLTIEV